MLGLLENSPIDLVKSPTGPPQTWGCSEAKLPMLARHLLEQTMLGEFSRQDFSRDRKMNGASAHNQQYASSQVQTCARYSSVQLRTRSINTTSHRPAQSAFFHR